MAKNEFYFDITYPDVWEEQPELAGRTIRYWYPTYKIAAVAWTGFHLRGLA